MKKITKRLVREASAFEHQIFENWAFAGLEGPALAAMFHQIQAFCAATRPAHRLIEGLRALSEDDGRKCHHHYNHAADLMQEIVKGEEGHGEELFIMARHILNRAAKEKGKKVFMSEDLGTSAIALVLREHSDAILGSLPGYDKGLLIQTRNARELFERRKETDFDSVMFSLGVALALEIISHKHLIPGEVDALVGSRHYSVSLYEPKMHYLKEHYGGSGADGAEAKHEQNVIQAVDGIISILPRHDIYLVEAGVLSFKTALERLWNVLDAALLQSGYVYVN